MNRRIVVAVMVAVTLLAGCSSSEIAVTRLPECDEAGAKTLFLMAQSASDATLIPCIADGALPGTWTLASMKIDSTGSRLSFLGDMTRGTPRHFDLLLNDDCDVTDAVAVPSDEQDAERFERVDTLDDGYVGERYYVFDGGCVTYRFDARGEGWSSFVHDASQTVSFLPRTEVTRLHNVALGK